LWKEIKHDTSKRRGLILYDGENGGLSPNIEEYWTRIEKQIDEDFKDQSSSIENEKKANLGSKKKGRTSLFKLSIPFMKPQDK